MKGDLLVTKLFGQTLDFVLKDIGQPLQEDQGQDVILEFGRI